MIKLDIGSGPTPQPGYTGVDLYVTGPKLVQAPMWDLPYSDETVDEIYSSHALEHVSKYQVIPTLLEWYRVLKPGGKLILEVPDLKWCCENWLKQPDAGWNMDAIFGCQENQAVAASAEGQIHKTGFTHTIMLAYLEAAGFANGNIVFSDTWNHSQNTLHYVVTK